MEKLDSGRCGKKDGIANLCGCRTTKFSAPIPLSLEASEAETYGGRGKYNREEVLQTSRLAKPGSAGPKARSLEYEASEGEAGRA